MYLLIQFHISDAFKLDSWPIAHVDQEPELTPCAYKYYATETDGSLTFYQSCLHFHTYVAQYMQNSECRLINSVHGCCPTQGKGNNDPQDE